jgi:chromosome segregation ATPase
MQLRLFLFSIALLMAGCQTAYYSTMEGLGFEKRDILVDRVEDARDAQQDAKVQFESALEQFIAVTDYRGGDLEDQYRNLKSEFEDSEDRARAVRRRIDDVERVAGDLFDEWEAELRQYTDANLRRASADQLRRTQTSYRQLMEAMRRAESKIDPVLLAFRDRVLFLKHNLNAQAIASLKTDRAAVESDIQALIRDMNQSITEADRFVQSMGAPRG